MFCCSIRLPKKFQQDWESNLPWVLGWVCFKSNESVYKERDCLSSLSMNTIPIRDLINFLSFIIIIIFMTAFYNNSFCYICYTLFFTCLQHHGNNPGLLERMCRPKESAVGSVNHPKHWTKAVDKKRGPKQVGVILLK